MSAAQTPDRDPHIARDHLGRIRPMPIVAGHDSAGVRRTLNVNGQSFAYYSIPAAQEAGLGTFAQLPASLKVVLENLLRFEDGEGPRRWRPRPGRRPSRGGPHRSGARTARVRA